MEILSRNPFRVPECSSKAAHIFDKNETLAARSVILSISEFASEIYAAGDF
jgi:hypothetical protein